MALKYQSGEEIKKGDHVLHFGAAGHIEFVAYDPDDAETEWYRKEYGGGIMIFDAVVGSTFIDADHIPDYEDLEFVSRAGGPAGE